MNADIEIFYSDYAGNIIQPLNKNNKYTIINKDLKKIKIKEKQIVKYCMKIIFVYENKSIIIFNNEKDFNIFKKSDVDIFNLFSNKLNSETVKRICYFWRLYCEFNLQDGV